MKTELLGQEKNFVKIKVDYEAAEVNKSVQKTLQKISRETNIPGFRKGHAPRRVLEMRFGKDALIHESLEELVNGSLQEIINEYELEVIASPVLNQSNMREGEPFSCELTFEVMPEVKLPELGEISVERVKTNVTDDMVEELVMNIRRSWAKTYPVGDGEGEENRPITAEDVVKINLTPYVEGMEEEPESSDTTLDLANNVRTPVRDALIGHSKGETVVAEFKAEDDYPQAGVAGKMLRYEMKILEVTGRELQELNEEFYKKFFNEEKEIHTEEEFRSWCRENLTNEMTAQFQEEAGRRALTEVVRKSEIEIPATLLNREIAAIRKDDEEEAKQRYAKDLKDVLGENDPDWESKYLGVLKVRADTTVRHALVVDLIAKENDIKVEKSDVEKWANEQSKHYQIPANFFLTQAFQNEKILDSASNDIRMKKVMDWIMTKVNVQDVDELTKPQTAETPAPEQPANTEEAQ